MPYDPTFELTRREYNPPHPKPEQDKYAKLLSIGCDCTEACSILDADLLTFDEWIEIYGEEVTPDNYSTLVII